MLFIAGKKEHNAEVRQRVRKGQKSEKDEGAGSDLKEVRDDVSVASVAEVSSDLNPQDPLQKVVRFSADMSLLLTGGTDGHIRVWEVNFLPPPALTDDWCLVASNYVADFNICKNLYC